MGKKLSNIFFSYRLTSGERMYAKINDRIIGFNDIDIIRKVFFIIVTIVGTYEESWKSKKISEILTSKKILALI